MKKQKIYWEKKKLEYLVVTKPLIKNIYMKKTYDGLVDKVAHSH